MLKCGGHACTHLFPLVLVEDNRCEEEDGVAEKPQEASLHRTHTSAFHQQQGDSSMESVIMQGAAYFGEAEVEVPLKSTSLSGDDLIKDRGQQECQQDSKGHKKESGQTLLHVVAVMLTFRLRILLPEQQHTLKTAVCRY